MKAMIRVWLARDYPEKGGMYIVSPLSLPLYFTNGEWNNDADTGMPLCAAQWQRAGGLRLKPGAPPVRIRLRLIMARSRR